MPSPISPNELHLVRSNKDRADDPTTFTGLDYVRVFIDSVKSRQTPIEPVEAGHRTASICHLGNIAMLLNAR